MNISQYSRSFNPNFIIIPQNGVSIVTLNGDLTSATQTTFLNSINAWGQEDLLYGYDNDNVATPASALNSIKPYLDLTKNYNKTILVTDYCTTQSFVNNSYFTNSKSGYISIATERSLSSIPTFPARPFNENSNNILTMKDAKNFLYLINPSTFTVANSLVNTLKATNYDVIIMDAYDSNGLILTTTQLTTLKVKANGGKRLVICYMSIGEAENYRSYWLSTWKVGSPSFVVAANPNWPGNFKVQYWNPTWQSITNEARSAKYVI
jgi:cysteinyl-tRNA synthetase, unknown class